MKRVFLLVGIVFVALAVIGYLFRGELTKVFLRPTTSSVEDGVSIQEQGSELEVIAEDLSLPWGIAVLPSGDYLVTERPGTLKRIGDNGQTYQIEGVEQTSEGGLLGIALHPNFAENRYVYLYLTSLVADSLINRVERYVYDGDQLSSRQVILDNIPGARIHDGGRIAFGPDGLLYIATGDAGIPELAQDTSSLAGKILRLTDEGEVPADNPFGNYTYSYGHRNPQGLAWDEEDRLWSSEHGPSGTESGNDEINLIENGANYGWPVIRGQQTAEGMRTPVLESGTDETWAPASLAYSNGSLFFAGLRGQTLYEAALDGDEILELKAHFREEFGRLRTVVADNDSLLFATSNTDGRGDPATNDDRMFRVNTGLFED